METFVFESIVPSTEEIGIGRTGQYTVVIIDNAIIIRVMIFHVTGTYTQVVQWLRHFTVILVEPVHLEQVESSQFLTYFQGAVRTYRKQVVSQQFSQFVFVVGDVERGSPVDFPYIQMAVDGEFHTVVPHGTDVAGDTGETTCSMQGH